MALRFLLLLLLLLLTILFVCFAQVNMSIEAEIESQKDQGAQLRVVKGSNRRLLPFVDCGGMCRARCGQHSRPNVCTRACGTCCARCKCVPPGTSGNRERCGKCYTDMVTHGNKPKCP